MARNWQRTHGARNDVINMWLNYSVVNIVCLCIFCIPGTFSVSGLMHTVVSLIFSAQVFHDYFMLHKYEVSLGPFDLH